MKLPIYMSRHDVESLLSAIDKKHPMRSSLQGLLDELIEKADKMAELAVRGRTNQWWENNWQEKDKERKKARRSKGEKLLDHVNNLSPEMLAQLKEMIQNGA